MDKKTLQLIAKMPPEMLAAWEVKHPAKWSIHYIAENKEWRERLGLALSFVWLFSMIAVAVMIGANAFGFPPQSWQRLIGGVAFIAFFLLGFGGIFASEFVDHRREWAAILESLEAAVKDSDIGLMFYLKESRDSERIREVVHSLLVGAARGILVAEKRFEYMRKKERVSEIDVVTTGQGLIKSRAMLDKMLFQAAQFGLSDGSPRSYFQEATNQLTI